MLVEEFSKFNERVLANDGTKRIIGRQKEGGMVRRQALLMAAIESRYHAVAPPSTASTCPVM
jgi:hypothetical protein